MSIYERHDEEVDTPGGRRRSIDENFPGCSQPPGQILGGIVGVTFCVLGVLAVARAGIDSTLNVTVVNVAGFQQSAALELGEVIVGLLMIAGAVTVWNRSLMGFVGWSEAPARSTGRHW